jgi:hypothetical protein
MQPSATLTRRRKLFGRSQGAAIPNLRHLEYFHDHARIESMLFDGALDPSGGTCGLSRASPRSTVE